MTSSNITHGEAAAVAEYFHTGQDITTGDLAGGMANALSRVAILERKLAKVETALALAITHPQPGPGPMDLAESRAFDPARIARAVRPPGQVPGPAEALAIVGRLILEFADNGTPVHPGSYVISDLRAALADYDRETARR